MTKRGQYVQEYEWTVLMYDGSVMAFSSTVLNEVPSFLSSSLPTGLAFREFSFTTGGP